MFDEITQLRAEIASLRKDLDQVVERLGPFGNAEPEHPRHHLGYGASYLHTESLHIYERAAGPFIEILAEDDTAGIYLRDGQGRCRASLSIGPQGAKLEFRADDSEKTPTVGLTSKDGHGTVYVASPGGQPRAMIRSTANGGVVAVMREETKPAAFMLASPDGGVIEIMNNGNNTGLTLHAKDDGGYIRCHEASGEVMAVMGGTSDSGVVSIFGTQGDEAVTLAADDNGGFISFCDAAGEPSSRLPEAS